MNMLWNDAILAHLIEHGEHAFIVNQKALNTEIDSTADIHQGTY